MTRHDGRRPDELRELDLQPDFLEQPHGSVLYAQGRTVVLCTATVEEDIPRWLRGKGKGWMTAEYSLLPASTGQRTQRGGHTRAAGRAHGRDPAAHRAGPPQRVRLPGARRADAVARLRRPPGGRRNPLRGDHRRIRRRVPCARPLRPDEGAAVLGGSRLGRRRGGRARARPGLRRGLAGRHGHERRHGRRRPSRRGAGDRRARAFSREVLDRLLDLAAGGIDELGAAQRAACEAASIL